MANSFTPTVLEPRYSTPRLPGFRSHGPKLRKLLSKVWRDALGRPFEWDQWQIDLIDSILEVYPPGHHLAGQLRWRQVVVVIPRQSGKSEIAAALVIYGLFLHVEQPNVIGVTGKSEEKAGIVYKRVAKAISKNKVLEQYLVRRPSDHLIALKNGGEYKTLPADEGALQGEPVTWGVFDELHLETSGGLWAALAIGQSAQDATMLLGITTAGDEKSTTLIDLQEKGRALSIEPDPESRFGYWEWSAPEHLEWNSPEAILSCNPRVACGAIPLDRIMEEINGLPKPIVERYRLCRTVRSKASWMDPVNWRLAGRKWGDLPEGLIPLVATVETTVGASYATISIAGQDEDGVVHGLVLMSLTNPLTSQLVELCEKLIKKYPDIVIAADSRRGKDLLDKLDGYRTRTITLNMLAEANSWFLRAVNEKRLTHDQTSTLDTQIRQAEMKLLNNGGYKLVAPGKDLDVALSFINACYLAHVIADEGPDNDELFV